MAIDPEIRSATIVLHDDRIAQADILSGSRVLHVGEFAWLTASGARRLCIAPAGVASSTSEISIHVRLAHRFGFENRTRGQVEVIDEVDTATASHVELFFRDQLLSRADMWQLMGGVQDTVVYKGQMLHYLGSETAEVKQVYLAGAEVDSAICVHPHTKPIFRSGCARYTILIEVSQEMLENWSNGELMYERLVDGFLPKLFRTWDALKVKHQVSIILFGRSRTNRALPDGAQQEFEPVGDFFHVLKSEGASTSWQHIVRKVKKALNDYRLPRNVALAANSNILEAIHLTAMDYADDQTDAYLMSTGTSIIAVTAGAGLFEADHILLKQTTDLLVGNSIGVDIVALSPKPLHPVPLFRYEHAGTKEFALPHWVDISFWQELHDGKTSSWTLSYPEGLLNDISLPVLRDSGWGDADVANMDYHDNSVFRDDTVQVTDALNVVKMSSEAEVVGSVETMKGIPITRPSAKQPEEPLHPPVAVSPASSDFSLNRQPITRPKRQRLPPHPLMQSDRKISVGPKGLAPSRGTASTTVSSTYAMPTKDMASGPPQNAFDSSSEVTKALRASLARKPSQQSLASRTSNPEDLVLSRPIDIQAIAEHAINDFLDPANDVEQKLADTTVSTLLESDLSLSATPKAGHRFSRKGSLNDTLDMLSPWVMLLNPCNPRRDNMKVASQYRKWQHVFPRAVSSGSFKWSSMCTPAALPLTAEYKPSASELELHYTKKVRRHILANSSGLKDEAARILVERLIDVRLIRGWQIVAIRNSGSDQVYQTKNKPTLMSLGRRYHEVQRLSEFEVQIVQYEPRAGIGSVEEETQHYLTSYKPKLRTVVGLNTNPEITYHSEAAIADWTSLDEHILGLAPMPDVHVKFRVRLCLVPVDLNKNDRTNSRLGGLSDEERRIEGIQRLTQTWQRQRYFTAEDQEHHVSLTKANSAAIVERDPNPLAIEYHTKDSSTVVNAHGPTLSTHLEDPEMSIPLFSEAEKHHSSNFDSAKLVKQMQELPPYGVEVRDRRWLTLTHLKCFRGDEMTTWLLSAFRDLDLREDAVTLGNDLMDRGIFTHVRQKHKFRDGHYFYQISSAHRTSDYPDTQGLFSKAPWKSVPATPVSETIQSPALRPVTGDSGSSSGKGTPLIAPTDAKEILLSQSMLYNVDPQRRSDHLQIVELHYDRIHNPENCYHIRLEWLGTSTKLVRDAISRWTGVVDGYGLRLVQLPLEEAFKFREHHPFDQVQSVTLAIRPPAKNVLQTPVIEPHTSSPRSVEDRLLYHKAILRKCDFALDYEAANAFKSELRVTYSFGPPNYTFTQFVHKSGLVLAQITASDSGDFLLLPNRLASSRISLSSKNNEGDMVESIMEEFKAFCRDEGKLRQLFTQLDKPRGRSPFSPAITSTDLDIPPMQLPPRMANRNHRH